MSDKPTIGPHCSRCGDENCLPVCAGCWQAITHADQLREALRALVDAMPECNEFADCHEKAVYADAVKWGSEILYACIHHRDEHKAAPWAEPLRAALKLLEET